MARPRRQTYTMQQYVNNVEEGYISNDVAIQRNPAWKPIVDGLVVTILNDDYIPPLILAEEESGKTVIVDGGSRTAAFMMICKGNYKIKSSVEDPIIKYKKMKKDSNGKIIWSDAEFDIKNKTFDKFPKELQKKFYEYQVETVIHECSVDEVEKYYRRYNVHTGMNANQKMFIYLPEYADKIRSITNRKFFLDHTVFTDNNKEKGLLERVVAESVMVMFHIDKWSNNGKKISTYLNGNSSEEEFDVLDENISRLENIVTNETKSLFNDKNTFIWFTLFNEFTKLGLDDTKFAEFLSAFVKGLRNKQVEGKLFDTAEGNGSTKDKAVITTKLHILESLMHEFLHINVEDVEEVDYKDFLKANVEDIVDEDDVELIQMSANEASETLDEDSWMISDQNYPAYLAIVGVAFRKDEEEELKEWLPIYVNSNQFIRNQQKAFLHMKESFEAYLQEREAA